MSHLLPERLAALADDEPTAAEAMHLEECRECAAERQAYRTLLARSANESMAGSERLTSWESLAGSLRDEGLMRSSPRAERYRALASPWWMRIAAAVTLVAGGVLAGRSSLSFTRPESSDEPAQRTAAQSGGDEARLASAGGGRSLDEMPAFKSDSEAIAVLARAEQDYRRAILYLASRDTSSRGIDDPAMYRMRLAALDEMAGTALEAVRAAPHDPVINRYYLSALGARDVTLRQLGSQLPAGVRLADF